MTWTRPVRGGSSDRIAVPILPPIWVSYPATFVRCAISAVVVDLPLVPVMATNGASGACRRRSRSENPEYRDSGFDAHASSRKEGKFDSPKPSSPQLQRGQPGERKHHRDDPEPDHDLRLGPAELLEMVVDRRHPENAFAGKL